MGWYAVIAMLTVLWTATPVVGTSTPIWSDANRLSTCFTRSLNKPYIPYGLCYNYGSHFSVYFRSKLYHTYDVAFKRHYYHHAYTPYKLHRYRHYPKYGRYSRHRYLYPYDLTTDRNSRYRQGYQRKVHPRYRFRSGSPFGAGGSRTRMGLRFGHRR